MSSFVEELFDVYFSNYNNSYLHLEDVREVELVSFTYGIFLILKALKIEPEKIKLKDVTLQEEIDSILKGYLKENLKVSNEEKLDDFIHDTDNVSIRKYVPSGTK